jgi:glyoxylase-like metal-dependent hydrolase (beta-lactamase superfamily II)
VHTNLKSIKKEFGSRLAAHPYIRQELFGLTKLDEALGFNEKIIHSGNILIIPTPGHTNSSLCYYYLSPTGKTYLFVGDTLYFMNNKWQTYIMASHGGCVEDMKASLLKLRALEVDVIVCSIISQHDVFEVTQDEWHTIIDGILETL